MPSPKKPECVPAAAVYVAKDNEWALGKKLRNGLQTGVWKYWSAPTGYLICEFVFADEGGESPTHWKRFHPNGELAEQGRYAVSGKVIAQTWWKSTAKTPEVPPYWVTFPKGAWRVTMTQPDRRTKPGPLFRYFDKEGREMDQRGVAIPPKPKAPPKPEKKKAKAKAPRNARTRRG